MTACVAVPADPVFERSADSQVRPQMTVFKYMDDRDVFQKFYSKNLANRLVRQMSASDEAEGSMLSKLKDVCGFEYTSKQQKMITGALVPPTNGSESDSVNSDRREPESRHHGKVQGKDAADTLGRRVGQWVNVSRCSAAEADPPLLSQSTSPSSSAARTTGLSRHRPPSL